MPAATNIPISATTTEYLSAVRAAVDVTKNFDHVLNTQLAQTFRVLDRESKTYEQGIGRIVREQTKAAAELARSASEAQAKAAKRVQDIGSSFKSVGQSLTKYLTAPLALVSGLGFNAYAQIDGMVKGLKAATGLGAEATRQFKEFYAISKKPGLGLEQTGQAGLQFETLGYSAQKAQKYVAELGNAIALGGKGKVEFGLVMTQLTRHLGRRRC